MRGRGGEGREKGSCDRLKKIVTHPKANSWGEPCLCRRSLRWWEVASIWRGTTRFCEEAWDINSTLKKWGGGGGKRKGGRKINRAQLVRVVGVGWGGGERGGGEVGSALGEGGGFFFNRTAEDQISAIAICKEETRKHGKKRMKKKRKGTNATLSVPPTLRAFSLALPQDPTLAAGTFASRLPLGSFGTVRGDWQRECRKRGMGSGGG